MKDLEERVKEKSTDGHSGDGYVESSGSPLTCPRIQSLQIIPTYAKSRSGKCLYNK